MINGLSERLKDLRNKKRLSQKAVSERLGISQSVVAGYESGYRTPSIEVLLALSHLYKCSTDYLLGKEKGVCPVQIDTEGLTEEQVDAIIILIDSIKNSAVSRP